jgi:hypothetical protein
LSKLDQVLMLKINFATPFKPNIMFARKAWSLSSALLLDALLALSTNIRLGWKVLSQTNTLAYFTHS